MSAARADFAGHIGVSLPVAVRERGTVRREHPATPERHTGVARGGSYRIPGNFHGNKRIREIPENHRQLQDYLPRRRTEDGGEEVSPPFNALDYCIFWPGISPAPRSVHHDQPEHGIPRRPSPQQFGGRHRRDRSGFPRPPERQRTGSANRYRLPGWRNWLPPSRYRGYRNAVQHRLRSPAQPRARLAGVVRISRNACCVSRRCMGYAVWDTKYRMGMSSP